MNKKQDKDKPTVIPVDKESARKIFDEIIKKDAEVLRRLAQ